MKAGRVSLVGAGPGDPELLTLRALRRLQEAEVVLYDALIDRRVLALAEQARQVDVGKRADGKHTQQESIERLLVRLARRGLRVVRLKGGDPFVFGRGGEEALALLRAGVPFEVVPGLSSALAGPALCGIPVTHRSLSQGFVVVTGHDLEGAAGLLQGVRPGSMTVVVLMARRHRAQLAQRLLAQGFPSATPAAVVQSASLPEQALWRGSLSDLARGDLPILDGAASLLVIGPTAALADLIGAQSAVPAAPAAVA